jgi:hypothetical protein
VGKSTPEAKLMCFGWMTMACCKCGIGFGMTTETNSMLMVHAETWNDGRKVGKKFYCPNGHVQHFVIGPDKKDQRIANLEADKAKAIQEANKIQIQAKKEILEAQTAAARAEDSRLRCIGVVQETNCWRGYCPDCPAKQPKGSKRKSGASDWRKNHLKTKHGGK